MPRRNDGALIKAMLQWRWPTLVASAAAVYVGLGLVVPALMRGDQLSAQLGLTAKTLAPFVAAPILLLAPFAWYRQRVERRLLDDLADIESLRRLSWQQLEMLVRAIYERKGYKARRQGGDGPDGGIDVTLTRAGKSTLVQCKQWKARQVPIAVVRELLGSMTAERADHGIVVTCGTFTGDAWGFAKEHGIELVDGMALVALARTVQTPGRVPDASKEPLQAASQGVGPLPCPACGGQMVERRAGRGKNAGQAFWGCTRYPACKGTRPA